MANEDHLAKLKQSVAQNNRCQSWNQWRKQNPEMQVDLSRSDLSKLNLDSANLFDANLAEAKLEQTTLVEAYMRGANLTRAKLNQAVLTRAFLARTHLNLVDFQNADLDHADLTQASMREANLTQANFSKAYLSSANLRGACAIETNFSHAYLGKANLTGVDLTDADLSNANIDGAIVADIRGIAKNAQSIHCSYLEFSQEKNCEVLEFKSQQRLDELKLYLTDENKSLQNLYLMHTRVDRNPLLRIHIFQTKSEEYKILERLGAGTVGVVYRARRKSDHRQVAIKIFDPDPQALDTHIWNELRQRFIEKNTHGQRFQHPCLIRIYECGLWDFRPITISQEKKSRPYIVMEHIPGTDLYNFIKITKPPWKTLHSMMLKIIQGIVYLHCQPFSQIKTAKNKFMQQLPSKKAGGTTVHHNIKPQNIMIGQRGAIIKLGDMGIILWKDIGNYLKASNLNESQMSGSLTNFVLYMPPEQKSNTKVTSQSDIFSLGLTFHYMITQTKLQRKWTENNIQQFIEPLEQNPIPSQIKLLLMEMVQTAPEKRPTAREVLQLLQSI